MQGKQMFFYQIQVDRVTEAEIASARKIIPSLEVHAVTTLEDAYRVAFEKVGPKLEISEYLSPLKKLVEIPVGESRPERSNHNFYQKNDTGWHFELVVWGD